MKRFEEQDNDMLITQDNRPSTEKNGEAVQPGTTGN